MTTGDGGVGEERENGCVGRKREETGRGEEERWSGDVGGSGSWSRATQIVLQLAEAALSWTLVGPTRVVWCRATIGSSRRGREPHDNKHNRCTSGEARSPSQAHRLPSLSDSVV